MPIALDVPDFARETVDQTSAQQIAQAYLSAALGAQIHTNTGVRTSAAWRFLIQYHAADIKRPLVIGRLDVNVQTGEVTPLTATEIEALQERLAILLADFRGTQPVDENGYITPSLAKRNAKGYLGQYISIFADPAQEPQWIAGDPPCWRVSIIFPQPGCDRSCQLGNIDVDARTGEILPLTDLQMTAMQRRLQDASSCFPRAATAAS